MKWQVGLLVLIGFAKMTVADEFKLEFSKDFVETDSQPLDEFSKLPEENRPNVNAHAPDESKSTKSPEVKEPELKQAKPKPDALPQQAEPSAFQLSPSHARQAQMPPHFDQMPDVISANQGLGLLEANPRESLLQSFGYADDPFDQMRDDFRGLVGEEVYSKMVWSYWDLKQLDNLIYSKMSQYDLLIQDWLADAQDIFGLNDQLRAELILPEAPNAEASRLRMASLSNHYAQMQQSLEAGLNAEKFNQATAADFENKSKLLQILNYLTIKNFLYLILAVMGAVYVSKLFKFLVRQQ